MYYVKKAFLEFLLSIKKFFTKFSKKQNISNGFFSQNSKTVLNQAASLEIKSKTEELKQETEKISSALVKKYLGDTEKTLQLIQSKKIRIYRMKSVSNILKYINEKQGFITPNKGFKALYLNLITSLNCDKKIVINGKSNEMFVFSDKEIDKYFLASQIYKFVAFRKKMPGFEYETQEKFKKLYKSPNSTEMNKLTAGDIFAIKEAIARDVESIDFAFKIKSETEIN